MIKKTDKETGFVLKGTQNIDKVYKGTDLVFEQGFTREQSGNVPFNTTYKTIGKNLKDYKIYGNSYQSTHIGKNMLNKDTSDANYYINSSGAKVYNTAYGLTTTQKIYVNPLNAYTYSGMGNVVGTSVGRVGYEYDANNNPIQPIGGSSGTAKVFVTSATTAYVMLIYISTETQPMLEEGNQATTYEPFVSAPTPSNPSEILSVGDRTNNLFNKNGLSSYSYTDDTYTVDDKKCVKIYNVTTNGMTFTNFKENTQYTFKFSAKYVATHGYVRVRVTYTDSTAENKVNSDAKANWYEYSFTTTANKTISNIVFSNAGNGSGYAYYVDADTMQINEGATALDYEPYGYKIPVMVCKENLLPYPYANYSPTTTQGLTYVINQNRSITVSGTPTSVAQFMLANKIAIPNNDGYLTVGIIGTATNIRIGYVLYDDNNTNLVSVLANFGAKSAVVDLSQYPTATKIVYYIQRAYNDIVTSGTFYPVIFNGSYTDLTMPYTTTNIYLKEPLRKIGNYADYIDFKNSKVVRNIKEITLKGTENWVESSLGGGRYYLSGLTNSVSSSDYYNIYCSHLVPASWENTDNVCSIYNKSIFRARISAQSTVTDFKTWLSSNNMIVDYPLETPTEESITLPNIPTLSNTYTTINTSNFLNPSNCVIKYKSK